MRTRMLIAMLALALCSTPAFAYVEAAHSFGQVVNLSSNILLVRVESVDKEKNIIVYRKVRDIKGKHPTEVIRHNIGRGGFHPREWQYPMEWAEAGKLAVFFHNGGASEMCIGTYWYQAYGGGENWGLSHGEPFLLRTFAGKPEKLVGILEEVLAGKETLVPCMMDGNKDDLHLRRARIWRLKASLKLQDYNAKRDFAGWGGEDFRRISSMPGFTHISGLASLGAEAQAISSVDFDGDGKPDLCVISANKVALLQNSGESLNEINLGITGGARAAVWADYNGDGKPDLLLATPSGPKLFTNLGGGAFRDDSHLLPKEPCYNLTAAAWIDHDGDGRPDILLGNGYHGLRLYRNKGPAPQGATPLKLGDWKYAGPFPYNGGAAFNTAYPPENEIDFTKRYPGKNNEEVEWKEGKFTDGQVNNLALFKPENNVDAVVYLHRDIDCTSAMELPLSLGSDDSLVVWLNGQKLLSENVMRACAPDQNFVTLKLKPGRNQLLLKVGQGGGDWAFYFAAKAVLPPVVTWHFEDVSDRVGLGASGQGSAVKGDTLTVCDVDGDGKPDFLYGAGTGMLFRNTGAGFELVKDSGLDYKTGRVGPVFADFDNDGFPDLFVPQPNGCKLYRNDGKGRFADVTAKSGALGEAKGHFTCAAWGDLDNDGHLDLVVGCLRGPNRFFRNKGDGTFEDASVALGLEQKSFNTQAVCLVDLNNDGMLDVVFNNEGQEACVLLGNVDFIANKKTPVTFRVDGAGGVGSRVRVLDKQGKLLGCTQLTGGDGRGGQSPLLARFALAPGAYRVEVRYSDGVTRAKDVAVSTSPLRGVIDEKTPKAE